MERYQKKAILKDLEKKMVLLAGPRQAGKTTLAKEIGEKFYPTAYLNYDSSEDRKIIQDQSWLRSTELLIFDELHKMPDWKNFLKGVFDTKPEKQKILVTGSARLEIFNQVGDSLAGRYFLHRLMPLSPAELNKMGIAVTIDRLIERGGFPEPFFAEEEVDAKRWRQQYVDSLLREDVLDFENILNVNAIRLVFELLRERVGSPVSYSSIAQDVSISPHTVKKYIDILEALYIVFRVPPFSKNIGRSLLKESKIYFFDNGLVKGDIGVKFENLVGVCLFKHVLSRIDYLGENYSLRYLRTKDKHEVDFALVKDQQIEKMIEVKNTNHRISSGMLYFRNKYDYPSYQVVKELKHEKIEKEVEVVEGMHFLKELDI